MNDNPIHVIGIGPGNPDYILPVGLKRIDEADVLIGGKRHLSDMDTSGKEVLIIKNNLREIANYIQVHHQRKRIAVLVSGDPGFHSMLSYIQKNTEEIHIEVIPGISSFTYFFSKLAMSWEDALLSSVHGEKVDYLEFIMHNKKVALLTDNKVTPKIIAGKMKKKGIAHKKMYIGENLSYENEKISRLTIEEAAEYDASKLCVVVIADE